MADLQALFQTIKTLDANELKQLHTYILKTQERFQDVLIASQAGSSRIIGLHESAGKAWMSSDFNEEFSQEFWLDEE